MSSIYNGTNILPELQKAPLVSPYEESTVDYVGLKFKERKCLDITIDRANKAPKVITISVGNFIQIVFRYNSDLVKIIGKIQNITSTPTPRAPMQTRTFDPNSNLCNNETFILSIDCSDKFESHIYDICSADIRDIDLFDTDKKKGDHCNENHHKHHMIKSDCDKCPYNPANKPIEGVEPPTDVDITPDIDLEDDPDFGTDPGASDVEDDLIVSDTDNSNVEDNDEPIEIPPLDDLDS